MTVAAEIREMLAALPPERRTALQAVRRVIRQRLPKGYEEALRGTTISYEVPLKRYPTTYNGQPLQYAALASQQGYMSLYLMALYGFPSAAEEFERAYRATGKRYDVGKSCVRFRALDDLPLELVGDMIAAYDVDTYVAHAEAARTTRQKRVREAR